MSTASAYEEVLRITRREAKNFAYGIMVLPRDKRRAIAAIYAFARRVDDVADGPDTAAVKRCWEMGAKRVWLHTCTQDNPAALPNYVKRGFTPYKTENVRIALAAALTRLAEMSAYMTGRTTWIPCR